MPKTSKLKSFINQWIDKKEVEKNFDSEVSSQEIGSSRRRAHQKLVEYEIEILQGKIRRKYQQLGELVHHLLEDDKKISKNSKEVASIRTQLKNFFEEIKEKQQEKKLGISGFDQKSVHSIGKATVEKKLLGKKSIPSSVRFRSGKTKTPKSSVSHKK